MGSVCRCQLIQTDDGNVPMCRGDLAIGNACTDYNECTINDACEYETPTSPFDSGRRCRGTFNVDAPCDDNNFCTDDDRYAVVTSSRNC